MIEREECGEPSQCDSRPREIRRTRTSSIFFLSCSSYYVKSFSLHQLSGSKLTDGRDTSRTINQLIMADTHDCKSRNDYLKNYVINELFICYLFNWRRKKNNQGWIICFAFFSPLVLFILSLHIVHWIPELRWTTKKSVDGKTISQRSVVRRDVWTKAGNPSVVYNIIFFSLFSSWKEEFQEGKRRPAVHVQLIHSIRKASTNRIDSSRNVTCYFFSKKIEQ